MEVDYRNHSFAPGLPPGRLPTHNPCLVSISDLSPFFNISAPPQGPLSSSTQIPLNSVKHPTISTPLHFKDAKQNPTLAYREPEHPYPQTLDPEHQNHHHTQSVFKVVLQRSIPSRFRQLILHVSNSKGYVDKFVGGLTSAKRLSKHFVCDKNLNRYILILWKYFSGGNLGDWFDRLRASGNVMSFP